jgi:hypothetical protein
LVGVSPLRRRRSNGKFNIAKVEDRTFQGVKFDSKREMERYIHLLSEEAKGNIDNLEYHNRVMTIHLTSPTGQKVKLFDYEPDFTYVTNVKIEWRRTKRGKFVVWNVGDEVIEDSKCFREKTYIIKCKAVLIQYGVTIYET